MTLKPFNPLNLSDPPVNLRCAALNSQNIILNSSGDLKVYKDTQKTWDTFLGKSV